MSETQGGNEEPRVSQEMQEEIDAIERAWLEVQEADAEDSADFDAYYAHLAEIPLKLEEYDRYTVSCGETDYILKPFAASPLGPIYIVSVTRAGKTVSRAMVVRGSFVSIPPVEFMSTEAHAEASNFIQGVGMTSGLSTVIIMTLDGVRRAATPNICDNGYLMFMSVALSLEEDAEERVIGEDTGYSGFSSVWRGAVRTVDGKDMQILITPEILFSEERIDDAIAHLGVGIEYGLEDGAPSEDTEE